MARTLNITDGTTTVNLLDSSGFHLLKDGWLHSEASAREIWNSSIFSEGRRPSLRAPNNVTERLKLKLHTTSQDNAAVNIQKLMTLIRQTRNNQLYNWEQTPVYMTVKHGDETNTRYAVLVSARVDFGSPMDDIFYEGTKLIREMTLTLEREPYWRSHAPQTLPTAISLTAANAPGTQADDTEQFMANFRGSGALSKIFAYDDNLAAFSGDLSASTSFNYWEVSGSTPAVSDIMYFGSTDPFHMVVMNIGTAAVVSGIGIVEEYWNGAWVTGPQLETKFVEGTAASGVMTINFEGAADWATTAINGETLYWIRIRISAVGSWTTSPDQSGQIVYAVADNYIEIPNTSIDGDVAPHTLIRIHSHAYSGNTAATHIILGSKSRGLTNFVSRLNMTTAGNPGDWAITNGTDTSTIVDERGPDGDVAQCTFGTDQSMTERWKITNSTAAQIADFEGDYHVYLRAEQESGSAGDVSVLMKLEHVNTTWSSETVFLAQVDSGPEIVSLGRFTILPVGLRTGEVMIGDLTIQLHAKSDNGTTPNLNIFDLVLIPIDEWGIVAADPLDVTNHKLGTQGVLDIDSGVLRVGSTMKAFGYASSDSIEGFMETRGLLPNIEPDKQIRIYGLFGNAGICYNSIGGGVLIYPHERWAFLRGAE